MKKMKRLLTLLLCISMLVIPYPAAAAEASVLTVGTAGGRRGDTVTLDVTLNEVNGIAGGGFNVRYDHHALTLVSAEPGEALGGRVATINSKYAEDMVRMSFAGTTAMEEAGVLLRLTFRIREDAPIGEIPVTAEDVKLYDVNIATVSRSAKAGGVTVQSVTAVLSSDSCLPGSTVKLALTLEGELFPCGGEFEIHYNDRLLTAGTVKGEQKLGSVAVNLSYRIDEKNSLIKVSWAAAEPVTELEQLCTVIFEANETAAGDTAVTIENMKFYDEDGKRMEQTEPTDGIVTVVESYNERPILYVVGGQRNEAENTATVQVAVDGGGVVCGGSFTLTYDPARGSLTELKPVKGCVATNPETVSDANGQIRVSWAEDSPALDNETILQLTFRLEEDAIVEVELNDVKFKDRSGKTIEEALVHSGEAGISGDLQKPVASIVNREETVAVQATLYDAQFCSEEQTEVVSAMIVAYADGRMLSVRVPADVIGFDANGIAQLNVEMPFDVEVDQFQLFIISADGNLIPMSTKVELDV